MSAWFQICRTTEQGLILLDGWLGQEEWLRLVIKRTNNIPIDLQRTLYVTTRYHLRRESKSQQENWSLRRRLWRSIGLSDEEWEIRGCWGAVSWPPDLRNTAGLLRRCALLHRVDREQNEGAPHEIKGVKIWYLSPVWCRGRSKASWGQREWCCASLLV